jgi:hypothetical protein
MNGAELPSGSVLHVEPASSNSSSGQQSYYGGIDATAKSQAAYEQPGGEDETPAQAENDEDLDDFFDSL